jgi:hypothetical protein
MIHVQGSRLSYTRRGFGGSPAAALDELIQPDGDSAATIEDVPMISIIICSADGAKLARVSAMYQRAMAGTDFELISITDARGLCEGYNRGVALSRGDVVIFSHDDVAIFCRDLPGRLFGHLQHCDLLGVAGTTRLCAGDWSRSGPPYLYGQIIDVDPIKRQVQATIFGAPTRRVDRIQALDGVFLCCRRELAEQVRFDEQTFAGFHMYDLDFSFRTHLAGHRVAVVNDLDLLHESRGTYDQAMARESDRFAQKHAASLAPLLSRRFTLIAVVAASVQEAAELLRPPHWDM